MALSSETKVKDVALSSRGARQVLEKAGVDYCCGGERSLHEACLQAGTSAENILKRLNDNAQSVRAEDSQWVAQPLNELTRHIREKHHSYVREAIRQTQALLEKVVAKHGQNHPEVREIQSIFADVAKEMIMHMQKEEQILFPYIDSLQRAASGGASVEPPFFQTVKNPIHMMMKEHDDAGELVKRIRSLSAGYTAPADACASFSALYEGLKEFETDLHEHVHLENNILFPRAVELEGDAA